MTGSMAVTASAGRCCALIGLLLLAPSLPARDVAGLYSASVSVSDRSQKELARGAVAALAQVLIKLTGNRRIASDAAVKPVLSRASTLMLQYAYATSPAGGLVLQAQFDEQALASELADRGVHGWGKERPDTLVWLIVDDGSSRQVLSGDEPGALGEGMLRHADQRGLPLLLPLMDIEEAQQLGGAADWPELHRSALALSARYATPATLIGLIQQSTPGIWEVRWKLVVGADSLDWTQEGDLAELLVEDGVDALGDALARRFADPTMLAAADRMSMSVYGVRSAADYARLSNYLGSLDTITDLFLRSVDRQRVIFDITARGGRAALAQSIAFGQVLAPVPTQADAYQLLP